MSISSTQWSPPTPTTKPPPPLLPDPALARVARAGDVADSDLILAAVSPHGADYFNACCSSSPRRPCPARPRRSEPASCPAPRTASSFPA
ncbi:hypothetical protein ACFH04_06815 [Streptomyces noboritoensis]|uniref:Uncharacterized protein n=1 Tax=Streptomyces noboritoensis TaxID=67337 RepID=A0ABV6TCE0_9ACTN